MKIAITGGSGFLGRAAIAAAEREGHEVWSFDQRYGHDILGDLSGLRSADAVVHLAGVLGTAELFDRPETAVNINVQGTLRILKWCRLHEAAYVGITMPDAFPSIYTATKVAAQRLASAFYHAYSIPVSHVRAFNAYGPGQAHGPGHPQKILPTFAVKAWNGEPLPIWGSGRQLVDLVHADDVGRMLVDAIRYGGNDDVFDAGTGEPVSVSTLANFVIRATGSGAGVQHLPMRTGEVETGIKAEGSGWNLLPWKPEMDWGKLEEAVVSYRPYPAAAGTAHNATAVTGPAVEQ